MRILGYALKISFLFVAYFLTAKGGLIFDPVSGFATLVWPPTGIALAALLLFGYQLWPGIFLGAFLVNFTSGAPLWVAFGMGCGNTLEALAGFYLLRRLAGFENALERLRDVLSLIVLAGIGSTLLSATIGVFSLWAGGIVATPAVVETWRAWWVGDILGDVVVAPLLLTWFTRRPLFSFKKEKVGEAVGLTAMLVAINVVIFWGLLRPEIAGYTISYLVFLPLIWAALRFNQRGAITFTFVTSIFAIVGTVLGFGPFRVFSLAESLFLLQIFMGVVSVTVMILAAVVAERRRAEEEVRQMNIALDKQVLLRTSQLEAAIQALKNENAERRKAEKELRELNIFLEQRVEERTAMLEQANKELEAFAYSVSHDLRNPLTLMSGFAKLLLDNCAPKLEEGEKQYLMLIQKNAVKMGHLIDDLLEFSRLGRQELQKTELDVEKLAKEVFQELSQVHAQRKILLKVQKLPPAWGDPAMMRHVLMNLLSNAIKYTRNRELAVIEVGTSQEKNQALYYVKDNGVGFDMRHKDKLFQVFQRLHPETEFEGTGVGLAIVHRIITRHGGLIWAESQVGEGSTFYFTLPKNYTHQAAA